MRNLLLAISALAAVGCGGATTGAGNTVMTPPADDKAKVESILKQYGITKVVMAMRDNGDYWQVSVDNPPKVEETGGQPKLSSPAIPDQYKVYKDGRVHNAFDDKPLTKK